MHLSFDPDFPKGENRNSRSGNTGKNGIAEKMKALLTNCIYLEDSSVTVYGVKIYGSPYQPEFGNWAFPLKRGQVCELWQYGLWSFRTGDTKLERFLHKNQRTQRKLSNFENWTNGEPQ